MSFIDLKLFLCGFVLFVEVSWVHERHKRGVTMSTLSQWNKGLILLQCLHSKKNRCAYLEAERVRTQVRPKEHYTTASQGWPMAALISKVSRNGDQELTCQRWWLLHPNLHPPALEIFLSWPYPLFLIFLHGRYAEKSVYWCKSTDKKLKYRKCKNYSSELNDCQPQ